MRTLFDADARRDIVVRVGRVTPESPRRWGRMEHAQLLSHLADLLRMALGDIPTEPPRGPLRFAPVRYLMLHVLPWPKGKAEGPKEAFTTDPGSWEADRAALVRLIERFANTPPDELAPTNPVFGRLTAHDWGVLSYRHLDHHLTQFGA